MLIVLWGVLFMYEQKICYIDLYRNGVKCGNMGHVRMEWDQDHYRFAANLCHMDRQTLVTVVLERTGGRPRTTIRNIAIIHGKGSAQSDWMTLDGNEEQLLFQASGEVYGICRLPGMRVMSGGEGTGNSEGAKPEQADSGYAGGEKLLDESDSVSAGTDGGADSVDGRTDREVMSVSAGTDGGVESVSAKTDGGAGFVNVRADKEVRSVSAGADKGVGSANVRMDEGADLIRNKTDAGEKSAFIDSLKENESITMSQAVVDKGSWVLREERSGSAQAAAMEENMTRRIQAEAEKAKEVQETQELPVRSCPQSMEKRRRKERHVTALSDDKWKQLCSIYPNVHPIGDEVDFLEITPADFVILRQEYQNLVRNSFLLHGYYNYDHILLGKYPDKYYIGVPGIMHEQERIAAAMFGFVGFERANAPEEQKDNRDQFGYYMMEVGI